MIVISDVHGCFETLMALVKKLPKDQPLCFVGDLIDRGPWSMQVIDWVKSNGHDCVIGNHEVMMIQEGFKANYWASKVWMPNGGLQTLNSYKELLFRENGALYGEKPAIDKFVEHIEWLKNLPVYIEYPDIIREADGRHLVVSHANICKFWKWSDELKASEQFKQHAIWNRLEPKDAPGIYNIHGHTPQKNGPRIKSFYANLDTGAFAKREPEYGKLTALQFPEMIVYEQENIDDWTFGYNFIS